MKKLLRWCGIALLSICSMTACAYSPRNGTKLQSRLQNITFNGLDPRKDEKLHVKAFNTRSTRFEEFASAVVGNTPATYTDAAGTVWFTFQTESSLPRDLAFWKPNPDGSETVRVRIDSNDGTGIASFDVGADQCLKDHSKETGQQIIAACKSRNSPEIVLTVPCGLADGICCPGSVCVDNSLCNTSTNRCEAILVR